MNRAADPLSPQAAWLAAMAAAMGEQPPVLLLPTQNKQAVVALPLPDGLPEDVDDTLDLLSSEALPLSQWLQMAQAYLAAGRPDTFLFLLREATNDTTVAEVTRYFGAHPTKDLVACYCALAAYHLEQARSLARDKQRQLEALAAADQAISAAKRVDPAEQAPWLAAGQRHVVVGDLHAAMAEFRTADRKQHQGRRSIAGLLAQAQLHYDEGRAGDAFQLYCAALREDPGAPAEVRLGLAACAFKMGALDTAEAAFKRALALEPGNPNALLGLAAVRMGGRHPSRAGLLDAGRLVERALQQDPGHAGALAAKAHLFLLRGDHEAALGLAQEAFQTASTSSGTDAQRVAALSLMGRAYHALGQHTNAQRAYGQASQLDQHAALAHLGNAQAYLLSGEQRNAATELENVLNAAPGNSDALNLLAGLYAAMPTRVEKTVEHFREAAARRPEDAELHEALGELLARTDPAGALAAYDKAIALHRAKQQAAAEAAAEAGLHNGVEQEHRLPARLLNNAGVLHYRAGHTQLASQLMHEALENMKQEEQGGTEQVTMAFNIARVNEATGQLIQAKAGYQEVLSNIPAYTDCHLRMACLARNEGNMEAALAAAEAAASAATNSIDVSALLASLHLERREYQRAHEIVQKLVTQQQEARKDPYVRLLQAALSLARYDLAKRRPTPGGAVTEEEANKRLNFLRSAMTYYKAVLKEQPSNIFAANGIGVCLAESSMLEAARETFTVVQEAAAASAGFMRVPDVFINMANVHLARTDYVSATKLYEQASRLHHGRNTQVLLYLARAFYDANDVSAARRVLLRAIHLAPSDWKLRFNLALCLQESAVRVFKKLRGKDDPTEVQEFTSAAEDLDRAHTIFGHLLGLGKSRCSIEPAKLQKHVNFCMDQQGKAEGMLNGARMRARERELRTKAQQTALDAAARAREQENKLEEAARKAKEAEQQMLARKMRDDFEAKKATWKIAATTTEADGSKRKKGSKAQQTADDGFIEEDERQQLLRAAGLGASDSDEEVPQQDADLEEDLFGEGDEPEPPAADDGVPHEGRLKRRAEAAENAEEDAELEDEVFGEDEKAPSSARAKRHRAALESDDEVDEQGAGEGEVRAAGDMLDEPMADADPLPDEDELFGGDDE